MGNLKQTEPDFEGLYLSAFPAIAKFIARRGGNEEQAKDVFQDALIIYYEQVFTMGKELRHSAEAYLFGISRHLWFKVSNPGFHGELPEEIPENTDTYSSLLSEKLMVLLETAGQKCLDILQRFYYRKESVREIQQALGYGSLRSATVQKFKCLEKVREEVKQKSLQYESFFE